MSSEYRAKVSAALPEIVARLNEYLKGKNLNDVRTVVTRLGRGGKLPDWFAKLEQEGVLPNADGKTVGSVLEMLMCADLEVHTLRGLNCLPLKINPAKGVDIPSIELGIKSPSENWCTSEPFTSAYERLLGPDFDVVVLTTNYQDAKKIAGGMKIQVIDQVYLNATEVADYNLCAKATVVRDAMEDIGEGTAKKALRFLSHVVQSDWLAVALTDMFAHIRNEDKLREEISARAAAGRKKIAQGKLSTGMTLDAIGILEGLLDKKPLAEALINTADIWVNDYGPEIATIPNEFYWQKFQKAPLNGQLGVSFALQWRYNFGGLFKRKRGASALENFECADEEIA